MVVGVRMMLDLISDVTGVEDAGITVELGISVELTSVEETIGAEVGGATLEETADEEGLTRRGVSLLTTQEEASSVWSSK